MDHSVTALLDQFTAHQAQAIAIAEQVLH